MRKVREMKRVRSGFTLVEILIVVVILGILAAVVIPQFTSASVDAKLSALKSNLQSVRSQIELYKLQHDYVLPTVLNFETAMTTSDGTYGPYLQSVPENPFSGDNSVDGTGDWTYNASTGAFTANDGGTTSGKVHADL